MRWSLIVVKFEDLNHCCFKHGSGLGELGSLREPAQLIHGHGEVGTQRWLDVVSVDLEKLVSEVAGDTAPSFLVSYATIGSHGSSGSALCRATSVMVSILVFPTDALGIGFPVPGGLSQLIIKSSPGKHLGGDEVLVRIW